MGIPYDPLTSTAEAAVLLGVTNLDFMDLVEKNVIEVRSLGSRRLYVNNELLNDYISKYGGREERFLEAVDEDKNKVTEKKLLKISRVIKSTKLKEKQLLSKSTVTQISFDCCSIEEAFKYLKILKRMKENEKIYQLFRYLKFSDDLIRNCNINEPLIKTIGSSKYNFAIHKKGSSFYNFFRTYQSTLDDWNKVDILTKSELKEIEDKHRKNFGL